MLSPTTTTIWVILITRSKIGKPKFLHFNYKKCKSYEDLSHYNQYIPKNDKPKDKIDSVLENLLLLILEKKSILI